MNNKLKDLVVGVATLIELGCIAGLAGIAFKRNNDCYKAECELISTKAELFCKEMEQIDKDYKIKKLEKELKELKGEDQES